MRCPRSQCFLINGAANKYYVGRGFLNTMMIEEQEKREEVGEDGELDGTRGHRQHQNFEIC